jgi:hypothetical protein
MGKPGKKSCTRTMFDPARIRHAARSNIIPAVQTQPLETATHLANVRPTLLRGPHVTLRQLRRSYDRLVAHLDGLIIAGDHGRHFVESELKQTTVATVFVACACATSRADREQSARLLSIVEVCPVHCPA